MAVGMIAGMASKKKERPNQLSLVGALSAVAVYFGWKLFNNRPRSTDGNSNIFDTQSNRSSSVDEAENQPENNTVLELLQENDDRGESGSAPFKGKQDGQFLSKSDDLNSGCDYLSNTVLESLQEIDGRGESGSAPFNEKQDGPFLSKSEGLNSDCNYLSTDDWKHYCSAISSDSPVSRPWSSPSSTLLNCELVEGEDIVSFGSTLRSEVAQCANNGAMRGHSKIHSEADADLDRCLSSSSLSSISLESSIENPQNGEGAINASLPLRLHVYDEYLSDPCLSPSMRSQVLRAKSIVQRLQKP